MIVNCLSPLVCLHDSLNNPRAEGHTPHFTTLWMHGNKSLSSPHTINEAKKFVLHNDCRISGSTNSKHEFQDKIKSNEVNDLIEVMLISMLHGTLWACMFVCVSPVCVFQVLLFPSTVQIHVGQRHLINV